MEHTERLVESVAPNREPKPSSRPPIETIESSRPKPSVPPSPLAEPEKAYRMLSELRDLQTWVEGLLDRAKSIKLEAADHFGYVAVANQTDSKGNIITAPVFNFVEDPLNALFQLSPFHVEAGLVPHLERVTIKVVNLTWDENPILPRTGNSAVLSNEAGHHRDVAFGKSELGRYDTLATQAVELYFHPFSNVVGDSTLEQTLGSGPFFRAEIDRECWRALKKSSCKKELVFLRKQFTRTRFRAPKKCWYAEGPIPRVSPTTSLMHSRELV